MAIIVLKLWEEFWVGEKYAGGDLAGSCGQELCRGIVPWNCRIFTFVWYFIRYLAPWRQEDAGWKPSQKL